MYSSGICQCTKEREVNVQKPGQNDWMRGGGEALCCISEPACRQEWIYFTAGLEIPFLFGVLWYKALHQQQGLCGNWEKEGIALTLVCLGKFPQRKEDLEATNQKLKVENHKLLLPSGASMNITPCSCDAQETLHIHGWKNKGSVTIFWSSKWTSYSKAKLQPNEGQAEIIFVVFILLWYYHITFLLGNQILLILFQYHFDNNPSHIHTPLLS